jgi:hypothetical protein
VVIVDEAVDAQATETQRAAGVARRGPIDWTYDRGPLGRE